MLIQRNLCNQHVLNSKQLSKYHDHCILINYNILWTSVIFCHSLKWSMAWLRSTPEEGREERQPAWLWCESPYKAVRRGNCKRGTEVRAENLSHSTTSLGSWCTSKWNSSDSFSKATDFLVKKIQLKWPSFNLTKMYYFLFYFILIQINICSKYFWVLNSPSTKDFAASTC